jgi:hypothetical protein
LNGERNPLDVGNPPGKDEVRPLPTGTIAGPDGKQYAMYGALPYDRKPEEGYTAPDTTVEDLSDPSKNIGVLPGISQASGAYDPKTNRMVIVGNPDPNSKTRMLYTSDPIDPANPNAWVNTVRPIGEIRGLPGDREGQLVALKGGGFMLVGSDNIVPGGNQQPITAITASTPDGLLNAQPTNLFPPGPQQNWPAGAPLRTHRRRYDLRSGDRCRTSATAGEHVGGATRMDTDTGTAERAVQPQDLHDERLSAALAKETRDEFRTHAVDCAADVHRRRWLGSRSAGFRRCVTAGERGA